jgi:hypothetical protein
VSGSHANPLAVKTDAPPAIVWDIVRCWVRQHPVRDPDPASYAGRLLAKEPKLEADFSRAPGSVSKSQVGGCLRLASGPPSFPGSGLPGLCWFGPQEPGPGGARCRACTRSCVAGGWTAAGMGAKPDGRWTPAPAADRTPFPPKI